MKHSHIKDSYYMKVKEFRLNTKKFEREFSKTFIGNLLAGNIENKRQNTIAFEDVLADLQKITLMPKDEIIQFVRSNPITYEELGWFYKRFGRLPDPSDCKAIFYNTTDFIKKSTS